MIIWILPVLIITGIFYRSILLGFFQQDEWLSFAYHILAKESGLWSILQNAFRPSVGHYQPLNTLAIDSLFALFGINYLGYAVVSVSLHLLIVLMVFMLAKTIFNDNKLASITALLFGISGSIYQATSWVLADLGVHLATFNGLLSMLFIFRFFKNNLKKDFYISLFFLIISLLFKEIALGMFVMIPVAIYFFSTKEPKILKLKLQLTVLLIGFLYISLRVFMIFLPQSYTTDTLVIKSQPISDLAYNISTLPFKGIAQTLIPPDVLLNFSYGVAVYLPESLTDFKNHPRNNPFIEEKVLEVISLGLSVLILIFLIFLWIRRQSNYFIKIAMFGLGIILFNTPIFGLAPERFGKITIIDSRNLYFISVGAVLVITSMLAFLTLKKKQILVILISLILVNSYYLNLKLLENYQTGTLRKNVLHQISTTYPVLGEKVVFYTESDKSFYGLSSSERILPFQSGFGQTLLVRYFDSQKFPSELLKGRFLWEVTDQGYKEDSNRGFGYFRNFELMTETIMQKNIPFESVIAFSYDSENHALDDITTELRGRLNGYFSKKSKISNSDIVVNALTNSQDAYLAVDGIRDTYWDSRLPYNQPIYFDIEFKDRTEIAQLAIDSYNNKNQNEVGYSILLSDDRSKWTEVFYSKRYTPDKSGLINLYFLPQPAKYIRIVQKGHHDFAAWVINELTIYKVDKDSAK